ncbi:MAG: hypothetical protein JWM34_1570 [Ilumatobacteraceae bacterium]|nr:hypothetical protein [Ilumatobacteraceae bacterium]
MYRFLFRPKWILFHLVVVAASVGMLFLAHWQWHRHEQRDAFVSKVEQREQSEPTELVKLLAAGTPISTIEYSRVTASGHFLTGHDYLEILQTVDGVNGDNVLSPFQIDNGPILLVNRGFIADGEKAAAAPTGTIVVGGLARTTEKHQTGQLTDNSDGSKPDEVRQIDLALITKRLGSPLAPVYIDFIASKPPSVSPPDPPGLPDLSGGPPHVSYTIQWCIFSVAVLVGWVLAVRRSLHTRQREAIKAVAPPAPASPAAVAATPDDASALSDERPVQPSA